MKILIVEDDRALGGLLRNYLSKMGSSVVVHAERAVEALELTHTESFDCAFVDLQLPDISGLDVLKSLKEKDPTMPVIMMSGYLTLEKSLEALRMGASDFLSKPFSFPSLMVSLERAIKERQILLDNIALRLELEARKELERLNEELEKNLKDQKRLFALSRDFDEAKSSDELYNLLVQWVLKLTKAREAGFFVVIPSSSQLFLVAKATMKGVEEGVLPRFVNVFHDVGFMIPGALVTSKNQQLETEDCNKIFENIGADLGTIRSWPFRIRRELFGFVVALSDKGDNNTNEADRKTFEFLLKKASLAIENLALYESLMANFYGILRSLVNALEAKDLYTGRHSDRVTKVALKIANIMGRPADEIEALKTVGYLHDIGKIGIPDNILNKPGKLTDDEFMLIQKHPSIGEDIVKELGLSDSERSIIRHHHERWDGKGYPDKLGGEDIPPVVRIITLADAYDAMSTSRPYRKAMSMDYVRKEIHENRGKQFDPDVVDAFFEGFGKTSSKGLDDE